MPVVPIKLSEGSYLEVAGGSVPGTTHLANLKNNQDAYTWAWSEKANIFLAIVSDGCGNKGQGAHEIGAHLAVNKIKNDIMDRAVRNQKFPQEIHNPGFWVHIRDELIELILASFVRMGNTDIDSRQNLIHVISNYGLFTINGLLINQTHGVFFSFGDGMTALNDEVTTLGVQYGNKPPYPMHHYIQELTRQKVFGPEAMNFTLQTFLTKNLKTAMIGTDGVVDLIEAEKKRLPGTKEFVGPIDQFWKKNEYFHADTGLFTRLRLINREFTTAVTDHATGSPIAIVKRESGLLQDDTTMIVVRRVKSLLPYKIK